MEPKELGDNRMDGRIKPPPNDIDEPKLIADRMIRELSVLFYSLLERKPKDEPVDPNGLTMRLYALRNEAFKLNACLSA